MKQWLNSQHTVLINDLTTAKKIATVYSSKFTVTKYISELIYLEYIIEKCKNSCFLLNSNYFL